MPARPAGFIPHPGPPRHVVPVVDHPSAAAKRDTVAAIRSGSAGPAPQPSVYTPWTALLEKADARYKTEMTAALRELDQAASEAGRILDTAYAMAAEAGQHLETAAWAAWHKFMAAADDTRNGILAPAVAAYDESLARAHAAYNTAMADAEKTYKSIVSDATRAQADVKSIVSLGQNRPG